MHEYISSTGGHGRIALLVALAVMISVAAGTRSIPMDHPALMAYSGDTSVAKVVPSIQFSADTYSATENAGIATVTLHADGVQAQVTVDYATSDGSAEAGSDYVGAFGTITFADVGTGDKTFPIPILDDSLVEGNETINLALSNPTGNAVLGARDTAVLIIAANDMAVDVNRDGFVDIPDLRVLVANFGRPPFGVPGTDVNGDLIVDILDLVLVARNLARPAPRPLRAMRVERAFPNLVFPRLTNLVQPEDGHDHLFVTEQAGRIRVFPNDQGATQAGTFLDITSRVNAHPAGNNEDGLLGLAFDPDYGENGYLYTYYSAASPLCSTPRCSFVSRFSVSDHNPNMADPQSEFIIMEIAQPFGNHNGGQLAFGPDGYLYIGLGDGGSGGDPLGNGQNKGTLQGSVLRIDVGGVSEGKNYLIPTGNPFVGAADGRGEIWTYGMRNPWRFSFDNRGGLLWAADVGQNEWEEIDILKPGLNYGWNIMEGKHCYPPGTNCDTTGLEPPLWEYKLAEGNCSITGGYVYRGRGMPSLLGAYVYGDFCSGKIWGLRYDGNAVTEHGLLVDSTLSITSFGQDLANNLYILSFIISPDKGIFRLVPAQ